MLTPGSGVVVEVHCAGVSFPEVLQTRGEYQLKPPLPFVPGSEVAGIVRSAPDGAQVAPGDRVAAFCALGGFAETAVAPEFFTFALSPELDFAQGAGLILNYHTAYFSLALRGRLKAGETVLVHGAAGGVGTVVGQIARLANAGAVFGVVSRPEKAQYARQFGYDDVFLADDFDVRARAATNGRGVDLALDHVGGETWRRSLDVLAPFGRLVSFGNASGEQPWTARYGDLRPASVGVQGFSISMLAVTAPQALRAVADRAFTLVSEGKVALPITGDYELADAADAHRLLESRASTGKLVLRSNGATA
jgi:NADPH2:quinone reductase